MDNYDFIVEAAFEDEFEKIAAIKISKSKAKALKKMTERFTATNPNIAVPSLKPKFMESSSKYARRARKGAEANAERYSQAKLRYSRQKLVDKANIGVRKYKKSIINSSKSGSKFPDFSRTARGEQRFVKGSGGGERLKLY